MGTGDPTATARPVGVDVFVSYTGADEAWATWVAEVLEAEGRTVAVQAWDSPAGTNFVAWIDQQMTAAKQTVAICSEAYFASHWCTQEWTGALAGNTLTPLRVEDCPIPPVLATIAYRDLHGIEETTARRRLIEAAGLARPQRRSSGFPGRPTPPVEAVFPGRTAPDSIQRGQTGAPAAGQGWDFFVSYTATDRAWAEWIAWQLEDADYRVLIQAWDFVPGAHWMGRMADGVRGSHKVIAVLSHTYLTSVYGRAEWEAAFRTDPDGQARKVIPIRIQDCPHPTLLDTVVSFDLYDLDADTARTRLLDSITAALNGRAKPPTAPAFPGSPLIPPTTSPTTSPPPDFPAPAPHPTPATVDWTHPTLLSGPLTGHAGWVFSVAFSPDGHTLATSDGTDLTRRGAVRLWDVSDPARPVPLGHPLTDHTSWVRSVAFSPDGHTLATGSDDKTVRLWDVSDPARPVPLGHPLTGHTGWVRSVAFSPDGHTLATGDGTDLTHRGAVLTRRGAVRLWDVSDPARPVPLGHPLTGHAGWVLSVAFSPDGRTLATGDGTDLTRRGAVRLWDVSDPARPVPLGHPLTGHTGWVRSVAFSPDGHTLATGSKDKTVRLWDVSDPARPVPLGHPLTGHTGWVVSVAFSPDGHTLATSSGDKTLRLWKAG